MRSLCRCEEDKRRPDRSEWQRTPRNTFCVGYLRCGIRLRLLRIDGPEVTVEMLHAVRIHGGAEVAQPQHPRARGVPLFLVLVVRRRCSAHQQVLRLEIAMRRAEA